jgi:phosphohistidine phosphatase SixA
MKGIKTNKMLNIRPLMLVFGLILGFVSCKQEDPILPLEAIGFDGKTAIISPSGKLSVKFNQRVTWKTTAGTATQNAQDSLIYSGPANVGVYQMTVKNERDPMDSLVIKVVVSSRADVLKPLQKGGYALVFRHAAADVGSDQLGSTTPEWWKSCDSKLARQLNDQGKKDATEIGKAFKNLQIPVGRVFASEYCRCYTTADLMNFGMTTTQSKDLTYYVYDESNRYANTMKLAAAQPIDAQNSVLVIHAGFSAVPSPAPLNSLAWGDAAVFKLAAGQTATYVTTIKVTEWTELGK